MVYDQWDNEGAWLADWQTLAADASGFSVKIWEQPEQDPTRFKGFGKDIRGRLKNGNATAEALSDDQHC